MALWFLNKLGKVCGAVFSVLFHPLLQTPLFANCQYATSASPSPLFLLHAQGPGTPEDRSSPSSYANVNYGSPGEECYSVGKLVGGYF